MYTLVATHPEVDYYGLNIDQIQAVFKAYARLVEDGIAMNVRIPLTDIGDFYSAEKKFKGGLSYFTNPPTVIPPSVKKTVKLNIRESFENKISKGGEDTKCLEV